MIYFHSPSASSNFGFTCLSVPNDAWAVWVQREFKKKERKKKVDLFPFLKKFLYSMPFTLALAHLLPFRGLVFPEHDGHWSGRDDPHLRDERRDEVVRGKVPQRIHNVQVSVALPARKGGLLVHLRGKELRRKVRDLFRVTCTTRRKRGGENNERGAKRESAFSFCIFFFFFFFF